MIINILIRTRLDSKTAEASSVSTSECNSNIFCLLFNSPLDLINCLLPAEPRWQASGGRRHVDRGCSGTSCPKSPLCQGAWSWFAQAAKWVQISGDWTGTSCGRGVLIQHIFWAFSTCRLLWSSHCKWHLLPQHSPQGTGSVELVPAFSP